MKKGFIFSINKAFGSLLLSVFMMLVISQASAQISVTATAGTLGPTAYGNLGAAFTAINSGIHGGAVTVNVTASTFEPVPAQLNAPPIAGSPYTSVLIKPSVGVTATISGNFAGTGSIVLSGATNVTIDGSNAVAGTTRDLTISNTTLGGCASIRLSPSAGVGASNNIIENCRITGSASPNSGSGIVSCNSTTFYGKSDAPNNNNTVKNCFFSGYQQGVFLNGGDPVATPAGTVDNNWTVTGSTFTNLYFNGIVVFGQATPTITADSFSAISVNGWGPVNAIEFSWTVTGATVSGNKINNVNNQNITGVPPPGLPPPSTQGIYCDVVGAATGINIYNNFISNIYGFGFPAISSNGHGIYIDAGGGYSIDYNSINLNTNEASGTGNAACICIDQATTAPPSPVGGLTLKDNLLQNSQVSGGRYALYCTTLVTAGPGAFSLIDYNDYVATGGFLGNIGGVDRATIVAMQTGFGGNVNSITLAPTWVSSTDLHLQLIAANFNIAAGNPIAVPPISTDIDGVNRSTGTPTIGAHELPNKITYNTPLPATCLTGNVTFDTVNIFCPVGVPLAGAFMPRIYFKKGAGPWFSSPGTLITGTSTIGGWRFTISAAAMGGVVGGDIISYYIIAQTTAATPTVFSNPIPGLVASDVNTVTTPPTAPPTYAVNAVTLAGLVMSHQVCYDPGLPQSVTYSYTGSFGAPNQYTLTWTGPGPGPTGVLAFAGLSSPITVTVPAGTIPGTYTGTLTIKNSVTGCTNATYTLTLVVNPLPANITGPTLVCIGGAITLSTTSTGGGWTSVSPAFATVGPTTGIVTGVAAGSSVISYTLPTGCATAATVNVTAPPGPITGTATLCVNTSTTLTDGISGGAWSSSNVLVASVGTSGVVTGVSAGTPSSIATISYSIVGCTPATRVVTVYPLPPSIVAVSPNSLFACVGNTTTLSLSAPTSGGTWSSANPASASIGSTSGMVTGIAAGPGGAPSLVQISYTYVSTGCISTNTVTIYPAASPITSSSGSFIVCNGLSITLSGPVGTSPAPGIGWTSAFPGYVSINPSTGVATGGTSGTTSTITYTTTNGCTATTVLTVSTPATPIAGNNTVCTGSSTSLSSSVPGGVWTSSVPAVATVAPSGVGGSIGILSGLTAGTTIISYTTPACNAVVYNVTVNQTPPPITGITNLCNGSLTSTVSTALSDPTPGGAWSICCGTALISPSGLVSGLTLGSTNVVTYTMPNACFTIAPIIVDTIPGPIVGPTHVCQYSNVNLFDVTTGGVWSSSNGTIASATASTGVVTGVTPGTVTISYTSVSGCYNTRPFTVDVPLPAAVNFTYSPTGKICSGQPITITASPVNGGAAPTYQWQLFGVNVGSGGTVYSYTPVHGDVIRCYMTTTPGFCAAPSPAYQDLAIDVYPDVAPVITITTSSLHVIQYLGQVVTFFSDVTYGGSSPSYQWFVDGDSVLGATNSSYARAVYDNDSVYCVVNGNPVCPTGSIATSNSIVLYADYLGASNISSANSTLSLFPNPNTGTFTLSGSLNNSSNEEVAIDVVNVLGQVVYKGATTAKNGKINQKIALGNELPAGSYVLHVNAAAENQIFHFVVGE